MLLERNDSLFYKELLQKRGLTSGVSGGMNMLGNMFDYYGPMLMIADVRFDSATKPETVLEAMDTAIEPLQSKPVNKQ